MQSDSTSGIMVSAKQDASQPCKEKDSAYLFTAHISFFAVHRKKGKGIDSLVRVCQEKLSEDPIRGCVFIFRSRRGTSIRVLAYDGQGYWLAQKRLSRGKFRWWPESSSPAKALEAYEAQLLMAAGDVSRVRAAPMWRRVNAVA